MARDDRGDPDDPLGESFQHRVFERGKRLEVLRVGARSDPEIASQFTALAAEQLKAYERLVHATERFPVGEIDSPEAIFRSAMAREMQQLREDVARMRPQGR